jgi:hypothetical protein
MIYTEGTQVYYKNFLGVVSFVCDKYICVLVKKGDHPSQDVKVIVYRDQFDMLRLYKESDK